MALEKSDRPWGRYEVLQESETHKVKCIWVTPGQRLSYQRHSKRAEHWFIVKGTCTGLQTLEAKRLSLLKYKLEPILARTILSVLRMTLDDE